MKKVYCKFKDVPVNVTFYMKRFEHGPESDSITLRKVGESKLEFEGIVHEDVSDSLNCWYYEYEE